jgi:hypothetical protein
VYQYTHNEISGKAKDDVRGNTWINNGQMLSKFDESHKCTFSMSSMNSNKDKPQNSYTKTYNPAAKRQRENLKLEREKWLIMWK